MRKETVYKPTAKQRGYISLNDSKHPLRNWHRWFAWYPIIITTLPGYWTGKNKLWIWWEHVERKWVIQEVFVDAGWCYREIVEEPNRKEQTT